MAAETGFERCYALANAGAFIAFVPLFALVLPAKVAAVAPDARLEVLSIALLAGGTMASIGNVLAGALSDRLGTGPVLWGARLPFVALGLPLVVAAFFAIHRAASPLALVMAVAGFQLAFNLLFGPLSALLADHVPDARKGRVAALLNLGLPVGTGLTAILTLPVLAGPGVRLSIIAVLLVGMTLPLLRHGTGVRIVTMPPSGLAAPRGDFAWAWGARFLVQIAGTFLFSYLYFYLDDILDYRRAFPGDSIDAGIGRLTLVSTIVTIVVMLMLGRLSDRLALRRPFLQATAALVALAMAALLLLPQWAVAVPAYALFAAALSGFLTIDAALVAQLLSGARDRARKLGIMNLTNTLPGLFAPGLALLLMRANVEADVLRKLMMVAVVAAALAAVMIGRIRSVR